MFVSCGVGWDNDDGLLEFRRFEQHYLLLITRVRDEKRLSDGLEKRRVVEAPSGRG
jgi:hypothetical protein